MVTLLNMFMNNMFVPTHRLYRLERFYYKGKIKTSSLVLSNTSIRSFCKHFGISPDCVSKKVCFRLEDESLPF